MPNYKLINPHIEGDMEKTFSGKNPIDAAQKAWDSVSSYFSNNVPQFGFTLEKQSGGDLHHFKVTEKMNGNKSVDYNLEEINVSAKCAKDFKKKLNEIKSSKKLQMGGGKHDDDDDDSDSSTDDLYAEIYLNKHLRNRPIWYWWYYPRLYDYTYFYLPTFTRPLTPYIEIDFYYWK